MTSMEKTIEQRLAFAIMLTIGESTCKEIRSILSKNLEEQGLVISINIHDKLDVHVIDIKPKCN